jgi:hypothetical protein
MEDEEDGRAVFEEKQATDKGDEEARDKKYFVEGEEGPYGCKKSQGY